MKSTSQSDLPSYPWKPQPLAARFLHDWITTILQGSPWLQDFRRRLLDETGTRLVDWIDHVAIAADPARLTELGFSFDEEIQAWQHSAGLFPRVILTHDAGQDPILGIKVESVDDFLQTQQFVGRAEVIGEPHSQFRMASIRLPRGGSLRAVERHGHRGLRPIETGPLRPSAVERCLAAFRNRDRSAAKPGYQEAFLRSFRAGAELGRDWACDLFFATEREFWQSRNRAAQVQYGRQQRLGLGWANHDHHTYRSSREMFAPLIFCLESMGFECRERFYAGSDAGWGAQVLEHPVCQIVVFADVDLSQDEVSGDFAHDGLEARDELGTVGLWCKLHGDSFLEAGMHHLECQFDFEAAGAQLRAEGIETMAPFTDLPFLKQAFTVGEIWPVESGRLDTLVRLGALSAQHAEKFASAGAIGSHLEILQRNDGYKGFNQTGVSKIIRKTDPRA